jgi:hypothetical protein
MGFLCHVPAKSTHKGFFYYYSLKKTLKCTIGNWGTREIAEAMSLNA